MGQSNFSIARCLLCKLSRLVLAAQALQCITAGSIFLSHANFWGSARSQSAGGAAGNQFHYWRSFCHRRTYPGERLRMAQASNHPKIIRLRRHRPEAFFGLKTFDFFNVYFHVLLNLTALLL